MYWHDRTDACCMPKENFMFGPPDIDNKTPRAPYSTIIAGRPTFVIKHVRKRMVREKHFKKRQN